MSDRTRGLLFVLALVAASSASAETHDLHIYGYCHPSSNLCGFGTQAAWDARVLNSVQEMNVIWKPTGKSFRPILHAIDTTNPNYYNITGCSSAAPNDILVCEDLTQSCSQYCQNLTTACDSKADCVGIGDGKCLYSPTCSNDGDELCLTLNQQQRHRWRKEVGLLEPDAVSLMLTEESNTCCSSIPSPDDAHSALFGIFCNPANNSFRTGEVWAHEMGHHFCLSHTFSKKDFADTMPDEPNHNGDFSTGVTDTPADPCVQEGDDKDDPQCLDGSSCEDDADCGMFNGPCNKNIGKQDYEWCNTTVITNSVDDGSPHPTFCTSNCVRCTSGPCSVGGDYTMLPHDPDTQAAMSYYSQFCKGPYVINGVRTEAFSVKSLEKIAACGDNFSELDKLDVCENLGGDTDSDGICDDDDNCPEVPNTDQQNSDGDFEGGDACDLCPDDAGPTGDLDDDGVGDICDPDIDGDDCLNDEDQHPFEANPVVGSITYIGCNPGGETVTLHESSHSDNDRAPNCHDLDDDNDGICDEGGPHAPDVSWGIADGCEQGPDPCPTSAIDLCIIAELGDPCPLLWPVCLGTGCVELFLKISNLINPDPTTEIIFDQIQILNRTLFVSALPGLTPSESAQAIAGGVAGFSARDARAPVGEDFYRMELWSRRTNEPVAVIVERFTPSQVDFGQLARGGTIAITPTPENGGTVLHVDVRYGPGAGEREELPDADGDGRPDGHDNCIQHEDFLLRDTDGDGFGDVCDADFDNDGIVSDTDLDFLTSCLGVDTALTAPISEPEDEDVDGFLQPQPDAAALRDAIRCAIADMDGDGSITDNDMREAMLFERLPPGPSGQSATSPTIVSPGSLADDIRLDMSDGRLTVRWTPGCGDGVDFAVYEGTLGEPSSHVPRTCTDRGGDFTEVLTPGDGDRTYLVVVLNGVEGSFGSDSRGVPRSRSATERCRPVWVSDDECPD